MATIKVRLGGKGARMLNDEVFLTDKYWIILTRYERWNKDVPDQVMSSEDVTEPKSKVPAPEPLDGRCSALQELALDFHAVRLVAQAEKGVVDDMIISARFPRRTCAYDSICLRRDAHSSPGFYV